MNDKACPRLHFCRVLDCTRVEGFKRASDRRRHELSLHDRHEGYQTVYHCQAKGCDYLKRWKRLDHFVLHVRRWHKRYELKELIKRSAIIIFDRNDALLRKESDHNHGWNRMSASTRPTFYYDCSRPLQKQYPEAYFSTFTIDPISVDCGADNDGLEGSGCRSMVDRNSIKSTTLPKIQGQEGEIIRAIESHEVASPQPQHTQHRLLPGMTDKYADACRISHLDISGFSLPSEGSRAFVEQRSLSCCPEGTSKHRTWLQCSSRRSVSAPPAPYRSLAIDAEAQDGDNDRTYPQSYRTLFVGQFNHGAQHPNGSRPMGNGGEPQPGPNAPGVRSSGGSIGGGSPSLRKIYPCVCHLWRLYHVATRAMVEDPTPHCEKRHQYVSQTDVHHHRHNFYYCTNCFQISNHILQHRDATRGTYICVFRCVTNDCINYYEIPPYDTPCKHGLKNSPKYTWQALYRRYHRLNGSVWVPDPLALVQDPSRHNLPLHHPMHDLYLPALSMLHQPPLHQPPLHQPPLHQPSFTTPGQYNQPPALLPGSYAAEVNYNVQYSDDPLTDMGLGSTGLDYTRQRVESLVDVGRSLFQAINSSEPAWLRVTQVTRNMFLSLPTSSLDNQTSGSAAAYIRQLETLICQYVDIIVRPATRTLSLWQDIRRYTTSLLRLQVQESCPWRGVGGPQPSSSRSRPAPIAEAPQLSMRCAGSPSSTQTRSMFDHNSRTTLDSRQILTELARFNTGVNQDGVPRTVLNTYGWTNLQSQYLPVPNHAQTPAAPVSNRSFSHGSTTSERTRLFGSGSDRCSYVNESPSNGSQPYVLSHAGSRVQSFSSNGRPHIIDDHEDYAIEENSVDEDVSDGWER